MDGRLFALILLFCASTNAMEVTLKAPDEAYQIKIRDLALSECMVGRAANLLEMARKDLAIASIDPQKWIARQTNRLVWLQGQSATPILALLQVARQLFNLEMAYQIGAYVQYDGLAADAFWCKKTGLPHVRPMDYERWESTFSDKQRCEVLLAVLKHCIDIARPIARP